MSKDLVPVPQISPVVFHSDLAHQIQVENYIIVGCLGAFVWDMLTNLSDDYRLLFECEVKLATVIYICSRITSLAFALGVVIFQATPVGHCQVMQRTIDTLNALVVSLSCLLFFFRVHAIFIKENKYSYTATNVGRTMYCIPDHLKPSFEATPITVLVYDTFIFVAISWRLLRSISAHSGFVGFTKAFLSSKFLESFSKMMLRDGQLYYIITFCGNLLTVIVFNESSGVYHDLFVAPNLTLTHIMACHAFRNMKLALIDARQTKESVSVSLQTYHNTNSRIDYTMGSASPSTSRTMITGLKDTGARHDFAASMESPLSED